MYDKGDFFFFSAMLSGSAKFATMIICPVQWALLVSYRNLQWSGNSKSAADVMLKEKTQINSERETHLQSDLQQHENCNRSRWNHLSHHLRLL